MGQFFQDMAVNPMLATGLLAGVLASVACGVMGPYVITRRIVFLAGAIAHMAVGGIGAAVLARHLIEQSIRNEGWWAGLYAGSSFMHDAIDVLIRLLPTLGAMLAALAGAISVGIAHQRVRERVDTLVGAMWAIGMAVGIMLIKFTPGYHHDLMSYLFGNIVFVPWEHIWLMVGLNLVIILAVLRYHKQFLAICLDEEQALLQGVNVLRVNLVLLSLVALAVVCMIQVVGLILVLALLTLPAATAGHHLGRLKQIMAAAVLLSIALTTLPRIGVYGLTINGRGVSPEPAIVLAAGAVYLGSVILRRR